MIGHKESNYHLQYTRLAEKFFAVHEDIRNQYKCAIKELLVGDHPENVDVKRLKGKKNRYYRIRIGGYRVVYTIINGKIIVVNALLAGPRGDVYKKMQGLK